MAKRSQAGPRTPRSGRREVDLKFVAKISDSLEGLQNEDFQITALHPVKPGHLLRCTIDDTPSCCLIIYSTFDSPLCRLSNHLSTPTNPGNNRVCLPLLATVTNTWRCSRKHPQNVQVVCGGNSIVAQISRSYELAWFALTNTCSCNSWRPFCRSRRGPSASNRQHRDSTDR